MKNLISFFTGCLVFYLVNIALAGSADVKPEAVNAEILLYSTPEMATLAQTWADNYQNVFDDVIVHTKIITPENTGMPVFKETDVALLTGQEIDRLTDASYLKFVVGRDVIVPVINSENPFSALIRNTGFTPQYLQELFSKQSETNWGMLGESGKNLPLNIYLPNDETVQFAVAEFLGVPFSELTRESATGGISAKIQADKYGLGWCMLSEVLDSKTGNLIEGIQLLPIDRNGNGEIHHFENIYSGMYDFNRGVWIGKYPHDLITNIYIVIPEAGLYGDGAGFVKWAVTDGQEALASLGHNPMLGIEKTDVLDVMALPGNLTSDSGGRLSSIAIVLLIIGGIILLIIGVATIFSYTGNAAIAAINNSETPGGYIDENRLSLPGGLYFDKTHMWAFMEKEGSLRVGVDDFLQHVTGSFSRVIMKKKGQKIKKNEHLITLIRDGKQIDLYSPVSGTVVDSNRSIAESPELINTSPYNDGWLYIIEPSNWLREISFMHMAEKHLEWLKSEFERLKDFLASRLHTGNNIANELVLQEGGMLKDHVLEDLDPEIWEDFQKCFIDRPI